MHADNVTMLRILVSTLINPILIRYRIGLMMALIVFCACSNTGPVTQPPPAADTPVPATPVMTPTATFDPCTGWTCTIEGVVYDGSVEPPRVMEGATVKLRQSSYCSPTQGEHQSKTGELGKFEFELFIHDTDGFFILVESAGFMPWEGTLKGMDCLFCSCPPQEVILER